LAAQLRPAKRADANLSSPRHNKTPPEEPENRNAPPQNGVRRVREAGHPDLPANRVRKEIMEDTMSNTLRYAAVGAALLAGTAAAHAQVYVAPDYGPAPVVVAPAPPPAVVAPAPAPGVIVAEPAPMTEEIVTAPAIAAPPTVITAPRETVGETLIEQQTIPQRRIIHRHSHLTRVHLTRTQRREVVRTIRYERPAPVLRERTAVSYTVGSVLPRTVPVYSMPSEVVYEAPALRSYAYTTMGDRVLLVDPGSNTVVDELY
jgi:hypothetical protein